MTLSKRAVTGLALALSLIATTALTQPYDALSGVTIPGCGGEAQPVDGGTLGPDAFGEVQITPDELVGALFRQEACVDADNKLKFEGETAAQFGPGPGADAVETAAEETAPVEEAAPVENTVIGEAAPATEVAPAQETTAAEPTGEPASPSATVESLANDLLNRNGNQSGNADGPIMPAQPAAPAPAAEEAPAPETQETVEASEPAPETEPEPPIAAAEANGRNAEPAQVDETVVTEENSRSSSEEFQTQENATAPSGEKKGLSNFEKFAIGAAGIVALDAILGNDREVVSNSGDRVVVRDRNGELEVLRDDDTLLRRPGSEVKTETFSDGSTRTTVTRRNGSKIVTIADASGRVIKRSRITADGREVLLIDDTEETTPVDVSRLPPPAPRRDYVETTDRNALQAALRAESRARVDRSFTLRQVRQYRQVRDLMPEINIDAINFRTGSAAIEPEEAEELLDLGQAMSDYIRENPDELFLVEGHTDAVGPAANNLALSDRRAESVALALTEYFEVPPENMIIQGYGESELLISTEGAERANRRAVVRRVTPLLR